MLIDNIENKTQLGEGKKKNEIAIKRMREFDI
jgi:hypothetical protein